MPYLPWSVGKRILPGSRAPGCSARLALPCGPVWRSYGAATQPMPWPPPAAQGVVSNLLEDVLSAFPAEWIYTTDERAAAEATGAGWPALEELVRSGRRLLLVSGADYGPAMEPLVFARWVTRGSAGFGLHGLETAGRWRRWCLPSGRRSIEGGGAMLRRCAWAAEPRAGAPAL